MTSSATVGFLGDLFFELSHAFDLADAAVISCSGTTASRERSTAFSSFVAFTDTLCRQFLDRGNYVYRFEF